MTTNYYYSVVVVGEVEERENRSLMEEKNQLTWVSMEKKNQPTSSLELLKMKRGSDSDWWMENCSCCC